MTAKPEFLTPANAMTPIGPYSHIAKFGDLIMIGAIAGVDPATGALAGDDVESQTEQIIKSFDMMLQTVGSDLSRVLHINVYLKSMDDFSAMNAAYEKRMGPFRPARTAVAVVGLPKLGALVTMNLTAAAG